MDIHKDYTPNRYLGVFQVAHAIACAALLCLYGLLKGGEVLGHGEEWEEECRDCERYF